MGSYRVIAKEIKEQILNRIKNDGVIAAQAAKDAGVSPKTVYAWLAKGIEKDGNVLDINKLKRENQLLLQLIGKLILEKEQIRGKK